MNDGNGLASAGLTGVWRRMLRWLHAVSGWFLIYLAVCGLIGFAFDGPAVERPQCIPHSGDFGVLDVSCRHLILNLFWSATICLPRFLIVLPAVALAMFKAGALSIINGEGSGTRYLSYGLFPWATYAIPLLLLIWAGARYWARRRRGLAATTVVLVTIEIVYLAMIE
jgi:hypothetical protein